jgi:hypothetical protein
MAGSAKKRSTTKTWKRSKGEDLELPSGNIALVKRPGMLEFIKKGIVPDTLMPTVDEAVRKGKGLPPNQATDLLKDPAKLAAMEEMTDRVLCAVVVDPAVTFHKRQVEGNEDEWEDIPEEDRDENLLYSDEVDLEDKMFIFQYAVGGTRDLERFREESGLSMGGVRPEQESGGSTE